MTVERTAATRPPARPSHRLPGLWVGAAGGAGFVLLYLIAVVFGPGRRLDQAVMQWAASLADSPAWARNLLTGISALTVLAVGAIVIGAAVAFRGRTVALTGAAVMAATLIGAELLKLGLVRPSWSDGPGLLTLNSFPSGHVAAVAALGAGLLVVLPGRRSRWVAAMAALPLVALTGLATVVLQWHRPSDAVASLLIAVAVTGIGLGLGAEGRVPSLHRGPSSRVRWAGRRSPQHHQLSTSPRRRG